MVARLTVEAPPLHLGWNATNPDAALVAPERLPVWEPCW